MSDAEALDWLDRLLAQNETQRDAALRGLADTDPVLHARLQRMLQSALSPEHSRALALPVLDGLARLDPAAMPGLRGGDVLAGYRLIRELGRGGMSVVWLAERADGVVKRRVALKMPMFILQDELERVRFERERDALAALSHPHVARLYDAGVLPSGQPFIVLEHVDGAPLLQHCDARVLDLRARLRLFLQVLSAVEHAHRHLVVHRDLKPGNVLVDADGQVKLLDFGIAKLLAESETPTAPLTAQAGGAMTPLYAAPEQLRGETISTLTDVYSLGVVLYELLTGSLPYRAAGKARASLVDVLESLARGELPRAADAPLDEVAATARGTSPPRLRQLLAGDLSTIAGKALRLRPEDRYGSAAHFAEDLKSFLDSRPIAARRPSVLYRARLALARHQFAASVAGAGLALVSIAAAVAWQQHRESRAHEQRTAAVRDFMFELVNDAEADEGQVGEVTGRQMVDGAVQRARREFGAQPALQGELLGELGRMFTRLHVPEEAVPVLEEAVGLLDRHVQPGDAALNKARTSLADALLQVGEDPARIRQLALQARTGCIGPDEECAKARAYASNILSKVASQNGDDAIALEEMRRSVEEMRIAFGESHEDMVPALVSLAIIARNAGQLPEADDAIRRADDVAKNLRLGAADRRTLQRTRAIIEFDLGQYAAARDRLVALAAQPAPDAERALSSRLLASIEVELGDGEAALREAEAALALLGDGRSGERPYSLQARARARALGGDYPGALADIDEVARLLLAAGSSAQSFEVLRARRYRAEFLLRSGEQAQALALLREVEKEHAAAAMPVVESGLMLDLLGESMRREGAREAARNAHEAAREKYLRQLPPQHPYLVRNSALLSDAEQQ